MYIYIYNHKGFIVTAIFYYFFKKTNHCRCRSVVDLLISPVMNSYLISPKMEDFQAMVAGRTFL